MEESTINGADFRAARRELRGAMRGLAEGKVLAVIPMSSGGEIRVSVFAERGRPPLVSIGLCHRAGEDFIPDGKRASSRGASSRSRSPSCTRTAGWPPMVMSGASACRGPGRSNRGSARKKRGRADYRRARGRGLQATRAAVSNPMVLLPKGNSRPDRSPL